MRKFRFIKNEIFKGLRETSKYLLSHHRQDEYYRCFELSCRGKKYFVCSRCLGIYTGIACSLIYYFFISEKLLPYLMIAALPLFALADWTVTSFGTYKGNNAFRFISGLLLGIAYFHGMTELLLNFPDYRILAAGVFYAFAAAILLYVKEKNNLSNCCNYRKIRNG